MQLFLALLQNSSFACVQSLLACSPYASLNKLSPKMPVRVHTGLMRYPWARLWYFCRAVDRPGRGVVHLLWPELKFLLNCADSTLWQWLREGRKQGAFRAYQRRGHNLVIWLGGKKSLCEELQKSDWGVTAEKTLGEILAGLRVLATELTAQDLQAKSKYAAVRSLPKEKRKTVKMFDTGELVETGGKSACETPDTRANRNPSYCLHISPTKIFASKNFIPYGSSQKSIGATQGLTDRTIRRHFAASKCERRQLVQAKASYKQALETLEFLTSEDPQATIRVEDQPARSDQVYRVDLSINRLFRCCGKTWINRCNLYDLSYQLKGERFARKMYKRLLYRNSAAPEIIGDKRTL